MTLRHYWALLAIAGLPLPSSAAFPTLHLKPIALHQLHSPTTITHAGDGSGRLFVCDQPGQIHILQGGMLLPTPFLDLTTTGLNVIVPATTAYSERGLLGLAFHPDFATPSAPGQGKFYVYYSAPPATNPNPSTPQDHITVVSEFSVSSSNPNLADPTSERVLLQFGQPQFNHNGGQLEFGPDGLLYIGTGDGGGSDDNNAGHTGGNSGKPAGVLGNALDLTNLLGKILRIDPLSTTGPGGQYGIPPSNPFVGQGGGVKDEIYAFGLRNPWRFSFDDGPGGTHRLFCADVGQGRVEEIDLISSGGNYGWRRFEGTYDLFPLTPNPSGIPPTGPIAQYAHPGHGGTTGLPELGYSVTGGFVYRGASIPALQGKYVFADYGRIESPGSGRLMGLEETSPGSGTFVLTQTLPILGGNPINAHILCLGRDQNGDLYIGTKTSAGVLELDGLTSLPAGGIYRLDAATSTGQTTLVPSKDTSIYSEDGTLSNAKGNLFAGRIANGSGWIRRALMAFNIASLPTLAQPVTASLRINVNLIAAQNYPGPTYSELHKVTEDWGEGTSNGIGTGAPATPNDATWSHRLWPSTMWSTAGGSFNPMASAALNLDGNTFYTYSSSALVKDIQSWIHDPSSNFGWILIGDEFTDSSAKRIDSRESSGSVRPQLTIAYGFPPPPLPFETFLATHYPSALIGEFIDPEGDDDGDGIPLQIEAAYGFSPVSFNSATSAQFTAATAPAGAGTTDLTLTFRRLPTTTDLTLNLQISSNLLQWTTIATSTAGATPVGQNGGTVLSDNVISGQAPARLTTTRINLPAATGQQFARLEVVRNSP